MNCVYETITTEESDAWGRTYVGYGIEAWRVNADGTRVRLHRIHDLFRSRQQCEQFVQMCNTEDVAPFHLLEIVDNLLAEGGL